MNKEEMALISQAVKSALPYIEKIDKLETELNEARELIEEMKEFLLKSGTMFDFIEESNKARESLNDE